MPLAANFCLLRRRQGPEVPVGRRVGLWGSKSLMKGFGDGRRAGGSGGCEGLYRRVRDYQTANCGAISGIS